MSAASLLLREALAAHERGAHLIPLAGKLPTLKGWTHAPRQSEAQIREWAAKGNIGLRTGSVSGIIVVDADAGSNVTPLNLPETPTVITGGGGRQYYYRMNGGPPIGNSVGQLGEKIDVRGEGGQVVIPGSIHPKTGCIYEWATDLSPENLPFAPFPDHIAAQLRAKRKRSRKTLLAPMVGDGYARSALTSEIESVRNAQAHEGNDQLNRSAFALGQMVGAGLLNEGDVIEALVDVATPRRPEAEARATIQSGIEAGKREPREVVRRGDESSLMEPTDMAKVQIPTAPDHDLAIGPCPAGELAPADGNSESEEIEGLLKDSGLRGLGENAPLDKVRACLEHLAEATNESEGLLLRTLVREGAIRCLKSAGLSSPAAVVDAVLGREPGPPESKYLQGQEIILADPRVWPEPVDGAQLLFDLAGTFMAYLYLPEYAAEAMALWTLRAHAHDAFQVSPRLAFTSPQPRCGKTTALTLVGALVPKGLSTSNISPAAVFRAIQRFRPTLLIDEADSFLTGRNANDELRGILNSGHFLGGARVVRCEGDEAEPRVFSTWAPMAVALIGNLPPTLHDRSITIPMRRKRPRERRVRLRLDRLGDFTPLRRKAARFARDNMMALKAADPAVPDTLNDRAADNWRPMLALADLARGAWPARAREAALALTGTAEADDEVGVLLLRDCRAAFVAQGFEDENPYLKAADKRSIFTRDLLTALHSSDGPWGTCGKAGKPLNAHGLAKRLKPFGIEPRGTIRHGAATAKGYARADFTDAFDRYIPAAPLKTDDSSVTPSQSRLDASSQENQSVTPSEPVTVRFPGEAWTGAGCDGVTDEESLSGEEGA